MEISKRFSLEHLLSGSAPANSPNAPYSSSASSALEEALELFSAPIFHKLADAPKHSLKVHDLFDHVGGRYPELRIESFQELIGRLVKLGRLEITERDKYGNHLVRLTAK